MQTSMIHRRSLATLLAAALLGACASAPPPLASFTPIVFVLGVGRPA